ncbi:MAG: hypothetical protein JW776_11735 [Candidatus Lokiarchaeota archaeon]|nr:hypothetical protein [Candidatus Lokiarchaeota archaeon]
MAIKGYIWSNDRVLKEEQDEVRVITTSKWIEFLSGKT